MLQEFNFNEPTHKEFLFKILKDPTMSNYLSGIIDLITLKSIKKYVLVIDENYVGIGFIIPLRKKEVEIRYCIASNHRGKKHANTLVQKLLEKIEKESLVYANIQPENKASKFAVLNNGFKSEDDFIFHLKR